MLQGGDYGVEMRISLGWLKLLIYFYYKILKFCVIAIKMFFFYKSLVVMFAVKITFALRYYSNILHLLNHKGTNTKITGQMLISAAT